MNTTQEYFQHGKTQVPNLTTFVGGVSDTSNNEELGRYITRYETQFLKRLLGSLYADYVANPTAERWVTLNGLLWDSTLLLSPVANYIFWHYYKDYTHENTGVGTVESKAENASLTTDARLCEVWNEMVSMMYNGVDGVLDYMMENEGTYPVEGYDWTDFISPVNIYGL